MAAQADGSDGAAVVRMFDAAEAAFGGVDVFGYCGGVMKLSPIGEADDALFDQQVAINLEGVFNGHREAARHERDGGRVVNFSSSVVGAATYLLDQRRRAAATTPASPDRSPSPWRSR